jgi:aminomethyltransferase
MDLKLTPLIKEHNKLKAKMNAFAGWLMPIQYRGIIEEHHWTRHFCSVFDTFHMGEFIIYGDHKKNDLDKIITVDLNKMEEGRCSYGFMLNERGGIIDDLIVYKLAHDKWMLVVNAGALFKDKAHLRKHLRIEMADISEDIAKVDVQGPLSRDVFKELIGLRADKFLKLRYYRFDYFYFLGESVLISRTGYTGELGYEIYIKKQKVKELWNLLLTDKRVRPAGLGARDTLRLEMGYPLCGQDINEDVTPLQAGLEGVITFKKEFIGKLALLRQKEKGVNKKLTYFITNSRRSPRHFYKIYINNKEVGFVTSGTFSPSLACGIGMGYIKRDYIEIGQKIIIKEGHIKIEATITNKPFYKKGSLKN